MGPDTPVNKSRRRSPGYSTRTRPEREVHQSSMSTKDAEEELASKREAVSVSAVAAFFEGGSSTSRLVNPQQSGQNRATPSATAPKSRSDTNIFKRGSRVENRESDSTNNRNYSSSTRDVSGINRGQLEEDDLDVPREECQDNEGETVATTTPVRHNCVESLQKLVQIQQEQIGNLEYELSKFASFFGEREDALLAQISALHGEIVVFRDLVRDNRDSRFGRRSSNTPDNSGPLLPPPVPRDEIISLRVEKCENGNLGFNIVPSQTESKGGVFVDQVSPFATNRLKNGDWILEVNGVDVSKARHEDAVEAFRTAKEPIVVEVFRRESRNQYDTNWTSNPANTGAEETDKKERGNANWTSVNNKTPSSPTLRDTCTQTEWTGGWAESPVSFTRDGSLFSPLSPSRSASLARVARPLHPPPEDDDAGCEVEYEEVTLRRNSSAEKLGLTLCYAAPDDSDTDIYVSEVEPLSVAGKDGRIIEGDQLLQINGVDVRNREQAVSLFSEKRSDVTLLVARPQQDAADDDDDASERDRSHDALLEEDELEDELEEAAAQHEKDSGVGRTDESTKNEESSEENMDQLEAALDAASSSAPPTGNDVAADSRSLERLGSKCASTSTSNLDVSAQPAEPNIVVPAATMSRYQSDASLDREMASLNREMEHIQLECESLVHRHASSESRAKTSSPSSSSVAGDQLYVNLVDLQNRIRTGRVDALPRGSRGGALRGASASAEDVSSTENEKPSSLFRARSRAVSKKEAVEKWVKSMVFGRPRRDPPLSSPARHRHPSHERDSAYNTGGSTPLTLELSPLVPVVDKRTNISSRHGSIVSLLSPRMEDKGTQLQESDVASIFSCDSCRRCCRALVQSESLYRESVGRRLSPDLSRCGGGDSRRLSNGGRQRAASDQGSSRGSFAAASCKDDLRYSEKNENYVTFHPCATMYTNRANLQHTIWLQQRLFRDSLRARETIGGAVGATEEGDIAPLRPPTQPPPSLLQVTSNPTTAATNSCPSSPSKINTPIQERIKMEWKVKKRADGTRYIARRPARNKILKERALKINEERLGLTTDDDAVSELKVGRYWNKEERKRHLERARDRKRKESKQRELAPTDGDPAHPRPLTALELSREKMLKKKGRAVFDDFTTVQEVLAHGNKVQGSKTTLGLLSVTTV